MVGVAFELRLSCVWLNCFSVTLLRVLMAAESGSQHYENTPMQYTDNFLVVKMKNFTGKKLIFFLFLQK